MQEPSALSWIVLERGAAWPGWYEACQRPEGAVIVSQPPGECTREFTRRVIGRLRNLEVDLVKQTAYLGCVVLAAGEALDERTLNARARVARLLARVALRHRAPLVITTSADASDEARRQLFALAGTLCEVAGPELVVSVKFDGHGQRGADSSRAPSAQPERGVDARAAAPEHSLGVLTN
ncbi:MAG: hypothetical protein KIT72_19910 [Polyangiaceae bacterium]|nr:hypothetical protein [Polyangiaceae bacterium]MCW5792688.1 hypothetical protein [Polyangiaceae bacterium]